MGSHPGWILPIFVPATRPERFAKAAASGSDAIIVDLEDAVAPEDKNSARENIESAAGLGIDIIGRVNASGTAWQAKDLDAVVGANIAAVMLPKAEDPSEIERVCSAIGECPIIALIETPDAIGRERVIASAHGVVQLAFGTQDMAAELGCDPSSAMFDSIRLNLIAGSRQAGIAAPLDGVSLDLRNDDVLFHEATAIARNGFHGRLLVHPAQVAPTLKGLMPNQDILELAERIVKSSAAAGNIAGKMIDRPVILNAQRQLSRARRMKSLGKPQSDVETIDP